MAAHCRVLLVLAAALLALPATAAATVRLGPDLSVKPGGGGGLVFAAVGCQPGQYSPCSFVNLRSSTAGGLVESPFAGIVTKWRFRAGCCTDPQTEKKTLTLKTFKRGTQDGMFGYGFAVPSQTGPSFEIPPGNQVLSDPFVELPARLPIAAGERIGIVADNPIDFAVYSPFAGVDMTVISNGVPPYNGEPYGQVFGGTALAIGADVEPDADGDLYGDETQDCAPADATRQDGCAPPIPVPIPQPLSVGVSGGPNTCATNCASSGAVVIRGPVSAPSSGDGSRIYIPLSCPAAATQPCGGYLIVNPPPAKKASAAAAKPLARVAYSVAPGATKRFTLQLSKAGRALLKRKRRLAVVITIQPSAGQPILTRKTLKWRAPKPARRR